MRGRTWRHGRPLTALFSAVLVFQAGAVAPVSSFAAEVAMPDRAGARATDAARRPGEQPDLRTTASRTTLNRDGTFTAELFNGPVHYQGPDGTWLPIDSSLVEDSNGYAWRNAGNKFGARFKEELGEDAVRFEVEGQSFTLTLEGANRRGAIRKETAVEYPGALAGIDLEYEVLPEGVKETLVLASADAPTTYRFRLEGLGDADLHGTELPDGSVAVQAGGVPGVAFHLAAPYAIDAADEKEVAPPEPGTASLELQETNGDLTLQIRIDGDWLSDPARQFPVRLDPTITIQPSVEDASFAVNSGSFVSDRLFIGGGDSYNWRAALQFELGAIPAGVPITNASLQLLYDGYCIAATNPPGGFCGGTGYPLDLHRMTAAWTTATPTNSLAFDATASASHTFSGTNGWMGWNITSLVSNWMTGAQTNYGVLIKRRTEALSNSGPVPPGRRYTADATLRPKLVVTYTSDAVTLAQPSVLHANGADLTWSAYAGGAPFAKYEVHRSTDPNFTPSASTLLATIGEQSITSFRDTTARPQASVTYRVLANTSPSNAVSVTLPADGHSSVLLQPGPSDGKDSYLYGWRTFYACGNRGAEERMWVGAGPDVVHRPILEFDLRAIPAAATVESATLSLWHDTLFTPDPATIDVRRLTRAWTEGEVNGCNGQGADWRETVGGTKWTTEGGDFASQVYASAPAPAGQAAGWHDFNLQSLVQAWVGGTAPNLGLLLKEHAEATTANTGFTYNSDDYLVSPTLRPKLAVTYLDGTHAQGPYAAITSPQAGATVGGNAISVTAEASDDRRVELVELLVDGNPVGSDASAPYAFTWNSTGVGAGSHTLKARATDDAGNVTTSSGVAVTVDNSAPPTTGLTAPANNATVSGTAVTVSATASDDVGVTKVEFYVDDTRIGEDLSSPYSISWNTLNSDLPFYDGTHTITSRAYDGGGKVTASAPRTATVANRTGMYKATFELVAPSIVPPTMVYDPGAGQQANAGLNLKITNNSTSTWSASSVFLRYRWFGPGHTTQNPNVIVGPNVPLGQNVAKNNSVTLNGVLVPPPALADGVDSAQYRLVLDLFDTAGNKYFADAGNQPLDNPVIVNKLLKVKLGLERFHNYWGTDLGAGMGALANVANGNNLMRWTPFLSPGRGLSTVVDLTYNSLEDKSETPLGNNWSLSISSLTRLGARLDIHPNKADDIAGNANKWIAFTDGDGTSHRFEGITVGGVQVWDAPPGVHLYLREYSATDPAKKWALTRPDRVTFFFDTEGYPTSVADLNGNELRFTLSDVAPGDDPGGAKKRVTVVTDAAGVADGAPNRTVTISYYTKAEAKKPQVRGRVRTITDHTGSELAFDYYDDGNLLRMTQRGGTNADGTQLLDRTFIFTYTTPDGSGPAIPSAANRIDPDRKTNQSTRLFSVRDPRGAETTFAYFGPTSGQLRWKLASLTDRAGKTTSFGYDLPGRVTTVTAPLSRVTRYTYDADGKVTRITDPLNQVTDVTWTADFHVASVDAPGDPRMEFSYNANGYLVDRKVRTDVDGSGNPIWSHTQLGYENVAVDGNDVTGKWEPGRGIAHISQLQTRTDPNGMATATPTDDYQWAFDYDPEGNLITVTDPADFDSTYAWYPNGTLQTVTDANQHATTFNTYDPSGQPTKITDAAAGVTQFGYDADGLLRWVQDANHAAYTGGDPRTYRSYLDYDSFGRLGRQSTPKSTLLKEGELIWSAAGFDPNDNLAREVGPHFGAGYTGSGAITTHAYDAMDRETQATGPDTTVDPAGERTALAYDDAGRLSSTTLPAGLAPTSVGSNDFVTLYDYDGLDRVTRQTRYLTDAAGAIVQTNRTHACYDLAGDLVQLTTPRANLTTVVCAAPVEANSTTFEYDDAHRQTAQIDPLGHRTETGYDPSGNVTSTNDAANSVTTITFDERNLPTKIVEPFSTGTGGRPITTLIEYDPVGNRSRLISPRAYDVANGGPTFSQYVTRYVYDALNQLSRVDLPTSTAYPTQYYVHNRYDDVGNLLWNSLPVTTTDPSAVAANKKNAMSYWDPGWIATSDDPDPQPPVHFDYTAEGWQRSRTLEVGGGGGLGNQPQTWAYYPDGMLSERTDRLGDATAFQYDANNNLKEAQDDSGITSDTSSPVKVQATWDSLDRLSKARSKEENDSNWRFTTYAYDRNDNITRRDDDGTETEGGTLVTAGRRNDYTYDAADWLLTQTDFAGSGSADNQRITNTFFPTGREQTRVVARNDGSGNWITKQTTSWTYFLNGQLKTLVTKNGATPTPLTIESHTVEYLDDADSDGQFDDDYINGNRTSDKFWLDGPNSTQPCQTSPGCTATYLYDARDRLVREVNGHGATTNYTLDPAGNVTHEVVTGDGPKDVTYAYTGNQLTGVTPAGGASQNYFYDPNGNLDCVTLAAGAQSQCVPGAGGSYPATVLADYQFDGLDRLAQYHTFTTDGVTSTPDDSASNEYDALDRVVSETESHSNGSPRTSLLNYLGLSNQVSREEHRDGDGPTDPLLTTKTYSFDAYGHRIGMVNDKTDLGDPGTGDPAPDTYTYGYDVHGSISLLLDDTGSAKASYGYRAYGGLDSEVTKGDAGTTNPLNAYRYSARRLDSGSGSIDMGARRFGPGTARFLQRDFFNGALADLGLALDPLTQNRFALAGGNPISFVEWDGHIATLDWGGGGATTPNPDDEPAYYPGPGSAGPSPGTSDPFELAKGTLHFIVGARAYASSLSRLLRSGETSEIRSAAARELPAAGRLTAIARIPGFKALGPIALGLSALSTYSEYREKGTPPEEALVRTATETGGGFVGALAGGLACGALGIATGGLGLLACGGAVVLSAGLGTSIGHEAGDVLHGQSPLQSVGDIAGGAVEGAEGFIGGVQSTISGIGEFLFGGGG